MKLSFVALAAASSTVVLAQHTPQCQIKDGIFCVGVSLVACQNNVYQNTSSCSEALNGLAPVGVKTGATCWQTSPTSGDAKCALNNTVYPVDAPTFYIAGTNDAAAAQQWEHPQNPDNIQCSVADGFFCKDNNVIRCSNNQFKLSTKCADR